MCQHYPEKFQQNSQVSTYESPALSGPWIHLPDQNVHPSNVSYILLISKVSVLVCVFDFVVNPLLGTHTFHVRASEFQSGFGSYFSLLLMHVLGGSKWGLKYSSSCHPCWRLRKNFLLLLESVPALAIANNEGANQWMGSFNFSVSLFLFQPHSISQCISFFPLKFLNTHCWDRMKNAKISTISSMSRFQGLKLRELAQTSELWIPLNSYKLGGSVRESKLGKSTCNTYQASFIITEIANCDTKDFGRI